MYNLSDIRTVHLEITSRCQASCPMCTRNIQGGIENPWMEFSEITLEEFKEWFPIDFIKQLSRLYMCGNTGDPIVARDTLDIFKYLKTTNPNIQLSMNTNGSARPAVWWKEMAKLDVCIRFGIDGLSDTHSLYRIGTDWDKIITNARIFTLAGGRAVWDMLVFDHNKHQVNQCEQLSKDIGFSEFVVKHTSRFKAGHHPVLDKDGKTTHVLFPSIKSQKITTLVTDYNVDENKTIRCKVKDDASLYVNAKGNVGPCCWLDFLGVPPMGFAFVDYKDRGFINPSLKENTLQKIFESDFFKRIENTWSNDPIRQCSKQCGKVDKFNEQFNDNK